MSKSQLLVVSRVSNQKVLPWIVSSTGAIRCYDTVSLSQKLSLHRHAKMPILIHLILWEKPIPLPKANSSNFAAAQVPLPHEIDSSRLQPSEDQVQPLTLGMADDDIIINNRSDPVLDRDTAGDISFRFHDFVIPNNWV